MEALGAQSDSRMSHATGHGFRGAGAGVVWVGRGVCIGGDAMNLYLIQQNANDDYETYDSAVVAAPDEETARNMDPSNGEPMTWGRDYCTWCSKASQVHVTLIGTTELPQGVVCASFNAG